MASDKSISTDVTAIEGGKIIFAPDVIATIANLAASEVEGVENLSGTVAESISGMLGGKKASPRGSVWISPKKMLISTLAWW